MEKDKKQKMIEAIQKETSEKAVNTLAKTVSKYIAISLILGFLAGVGLGIFTGVKYTQQKLVDRGIGFFDDTLNFEFYMPFKRWED